MKMKKLFALFIVLCTSNAMATGIPTFDGATVLESLAEAKRWEQKLKQYEADYKMFENQYKQAVAQYNSITGIRDLNSAMGYLDQYWTMDDLTNWLSKPDRILNSGFDSLSPNLKKDVTGLGFDKMCDDKNASKDSYQYKLRKNCEGRVVINLLQSAKYEKLLKQRQKEDQKLQEKMSDIAQATDSKQSADYSNQLLGDLIQQQYRLQRMFEDQQADLNSKRLQDLKQEADYKSWLSQYEK